MESHWVYKLHLRAGPHGQQQAINTKQSQRHFLLIVCLHLMVFVYYGFVYMCLYFLCSFFASFSFLFIPFVLFSL